ncbi:hypothetical protein GWI33_018285 [Rhynchophorus ferrugineus]|uniref:Tetraspanin n=1 Tax=Rhynchophorus ferrugineus TaxID=354439 RepID=A0A834HU23_RHYFE|nr:hypothetical protein GWI33_018285 [Rhynchophorus ferrugineus]
MGCSEGLARLLVFIVNFAFFLVGVALLVIGALNYGNYSIIDDIIPSEYNAVKYVSISAIVVGSIIVFISFLGCCGALRSSTCMLTTYGAILFVIFLAQVGLGIYALLTIKDKADFTNQVNKLLEKLMDDCKQNNKNDRCKVVEDIQNTFQCCGFKSPNEWTSSSPQCPSGVTQGCSTVLNEWLEKSTRLLGIVAIAVSAVEVIAAILALCLSNCIRSSTRQNVYM